MGALLTFPRHCLCVGHARVDLAENKQQVLGKQSTSIIPPCAQIKQKRHSEEKSKIRYPDVFFSDRWDAPKQGLGF